MEILADDASLGSLANGSPEMAFTAPCASKTEILGYLDGLMRDWEMSRYAMDDFIAHGERVVAVGEVAWRHRSTGKTVETPKVDIWRIRDGKAVDFREFYDTAGSLEAARP